MLNGFPGFGVETELAVDSSNGLLMGVRPGLTIADADCLALPITKGRMRSRLDFDEAADEESESNGLAACLSKGFVERLLDCLAIR